MKKTILSLVCWIAAFNLYRLASTDEMKNLVFGIFMALTIFFAFLRVQELTKDLAEKHICEYVFFLCFYNVIDEYYKIYEQIYLSEYIVGFGGIIVFYFKYKYKKKWTTKFKTH